MRSMLATACAAIGVALLVGCGSSDVPGTGPGKSGQPSSGLSGKVEVDGSSTVYLISEAMAVAFKKANPSVQTQVGKTGTGGGFKRFVKGETDISDASRPITPDEFKQCQANKVSFIELPVAYDGLSFVVNPKNTFVKSLTIQNLQKIFLADSPAKTWKDVNSAWPAEPIKVHMPDENSGTFDYFMEVVGKKKQVRSDASRNVEDNVMVEAVKNDKDAIAFFGCAYYYANKDKLTVVPIVNPKLNKPIEPTVENIKSGDYAPFSRPLFIYVNVDSLKQPQVKKFVERYLDTAASVSEKVGYVQLPAEVYKTAKAHYQERLPGTCYVTPAEEERHGPLAEVFKKENLRDVK